MIARLSRSPSLRKYHYAFPRFVRRTSNMSSVTANQTPAADEKLQFTIDEEPLGFPALDGFGYFQGGSGLSFGPGNRFKLQAKLGYGTMSTVWLAHDSVDDTHIAIKILSGNATKLNQEHKLRELEVLQRLSLAASDSDRCPRLLSHFVHPGTDDDGEHLCLMTEFFWSNALDSQELLKNGYVPPPIVKRMLKHLLQGLVRLHSCGIAHTDIKADNIMNDLGSNWSTDAINKWVSENPPSTYPPRRSLTKMVSVFRSQSLPPPTLDELFSCNFKLADFSHAQFVNDQTTDEIMPFGLRAPEIVLGGEWNESVDIWTVGCLAYTSLSHENLFDRKTFEDSDAPLLYQMTAVSGELFQEEFVKRCARNLKRFYLNCNPPKSEGIVRPPIKESILNTGCILSPRDLAGATDFMAKCLRLSPKNRATAQELLEHPWLKPNTVN